MTLMRDTTSGATRALGLQHLAQHAVDAEAHHQAVLERLDVDVGGVLLDRLGEHRVDQADDRRIVVALEQVRLLGQVLRQVRQIGGVLEPDLHGFAAAFVGLAQQLVELPRSATRCELQRQAQVAAHFGQRHAARPVRDRRNRRRPSSTPRTSTPWRRRR